MSKSAAEKFDLEFRTEFLLSSFASEPELTVKFKLTLGAVKFIA